METKITLVPCCLTSYKGGTSFSELMITHLLGHKDVYDHEDNFHDLWILAKIHGITKMEVRRSSGVIKTWYANRYVNDTITSNWK